MAALPSALTVTQSWHQLSLNEWISWLSLGPAVVAAVAVVLGLAGVAAYRTSIGVFAALLAAWLPHISGAFSTAWLMMVVTPVLSGVLVSVVWVDLRRSLVVRDVRSLMAYRTLTVVWSGVIVPWVIDRWSADAWPQAAAWYTTSLALATAVAAIATTAPRPSAGCGVINALARRDSPFEKTG
jgi:hypothetical protein